MGVLYISMRRAGGESALRAEPFAMLQEVLAMNHSLTVTYYHHSGFSVASGDVLLVFDYWTGKQTRLPESLRITPEYIAGFREVYVFISHDHVDHFDEVVYSWEQHAPVTYVIASDMDEKAKGRRIAPGGETTLSDRVHVRTYGSTDAGVSFMVTLDGVRFFHAGDLNFWHWREVCSAKQIAMADEDFRTEVMPLQGEDIDVCFFPVDPRMGMMFDAGANYFIMTVKPRLLLPMHFWGRGDIINEFARRARTRETEVVPLVKQGQSIRLEFEDDGFMNIVMMPAPVVPGSGASTETTVNLEGYEGTDPFLETDLPVDME